MPAARRRSRWVGVAFVYLFVPIARAQTAIASIHEHIAQGTEPPIPIPTAIPDLPGIGDGGPIPDLPGIGGPSGTIPTARAIRLVGLPDLPVLIRRGSS